MIYTDKIKEAVHLASLAHKNQKRRLVGYPYISHPLAVLFLVSNFTKNEDVLVASILHDIVEDSDVTLLDVETKFGKKVRDMVDILTEDISLSIKKDIKQKQLERFKNADKDVLLIKLADIIHNFCDTIIILENYSKEEYLDSFGSNTQERINFAEERIKIIEEAWTDNPLLEETKNRFENYKKLLNKFELLNL